MRRLLCFRTWCYVFALGVLLLGSQNSYGVNLIVNGDFEAGNTGFTSDYTYFSTPIDRDTSYAIGNDPYLWHGYRMWASFGDHTTGQGLMFIGDGAIVSDKVLWQQTVPVTSNTWYVFSYWGASSSSNSPAQLRVHINGIPIGSDFVLPSQTGQWMRFSALWNSGSTNQATIRLVNQNTSGSGNDFALDDISLQAVVPEPGTLCLFSIGSMAVLLNRRKRR